MENMKTSAHAAALYSSTSLPDAFGMTYSDIGEFFDGKAYADWRKGKEGEMKLLAGIAERLNNVIKACGNIAKAVSYTRR